MKIFSTDQYIEKLKIRPVNVSDLNSGSSIKYYTIDFVSGDGCDWVKFEDFSSKLKKNINKDYGLIFRRYPMLDNKKSKLLTAKYDEQSNCFEYCLCIWGAVIDRMMFKCLDPLKLRQMMITFGFDYENRKYDTKYVEQYVSDVFNSNNLPNSGNFWYLKFNPKTCQNNLIFDLFHNTIDYTNEYFATSVSCTDDFVTSSGTHLNDFSLIVRLFPIKEISLNNKCKNAAVDCLNYQYIRLIHSFNKKLYNVID